MTTDSKAVKLRRVKATEDTVTGQWNHPQAQGNVEITIQEGMIALEWTGNHIRSNRELVQVNGSTLKVDMLMDTSRGKCKYAFQLTDILVD
jgi:hypothetical protein